MLANITIKVQLTTEGPFVIVTVREQCVHLPWSTVRDVQEETPNHPSRLRYNSPCYEPSSVFFFADSSTSVTFETFPPDDTRSDISVTFGTDGICSCPQTQNQTISTNQASTVRSSQTKPPDAETKPVSSLTVAPLTERSPPRMAPPELLTRLLTVAPPEPMITPLKIGSDALDIRTCSHNAHA